MNTVQKRTIYLTHTSLTQQVPHPFSPLLKNDESIAFDLQSRTLVYEKGNSVPIVVRLTQRDTHLLLPLFAFYPYHVDKLTFAMGYTLDLFEYYEFLQTGARKKEEDTKRFPIAEFPIAEGIKRMRSRLKSLGITITCVQQTGYVLSRCADVAVDEEGSGHEMLLVCR